MFHNVLAAIDPSPISQSVFDCALSLAQSFQAPLGLLYIFSLDEFEILPQATLAALEAYPTGLDHPLKCYVGRLETEALKTDSDPQITLLRSYTRHAIAQGVATEFFVGVGDPGAAICDFAKGWQANLIVIGHRGRSGLTELLLGSVSNHVVHHAPCSVHLVYPPKPIEFEVMEAIDAALR